MPVGMRLTQPHDNPRHDEPPRESGATFPADEVVWGVAVRPGFDELDDPFYHRGVTQHAYLEGNDSIALCGFRPPLSGPRHRRRPRLSLPSAGVNPMCGTCARKVVAPRSRVAVPVQPGRPAIAVPIAPGVPAPPAVAAGVSPRTFAPGVAAAAPISSRPDQRVGDPEAPAAARAGPAAAQAGSAAPQAGSATPGADADPPVPDAGPAPQPHAPGGTPVSPWVRRAAVDPSSAGTKGGLMSRGIRPDLSD
jgi:hypothetical protein